MDDRQQQRALGQTEIAEHSNSFNNNRMSCTLYGEVIWPSETSTEKYEKRKFEWREARRAHTL